MPRINKILTTFLLWVIGIIYLLVPSINTELLVNGTQSGKSFAFLYLISGITLIAVFQRIFLSQKPWRFGIIDLILFFWASYLLINGWIKAVPVSLRYLEFWGLIILYLIIRKIPENYLKWLYISLIIGGGIQALYGNLQLWGYYPSHHGMFKMTGSFFNPGPYAGYLSGILPVALGFYLFKIEVTFQKNTLWNNKLINRLKQVYKKQKNYLKTHFRTNTNSLARLEEKQQTIKARNKPDLVNILTILPLILIALVLPASRSRAAWIAVIFSSIYLLVVHYKSNINDFLKRVTKSTLNKIGIISLLLILTSISIAGLYHFKKGSADGRLLIWEVSWEMIKEKPIFGYGFDQFKAYYMDSQAEFFEHHPDSEKAMVAGDTNYTFNELLQQTVENGISGLVLILLVLGSVIVSGFRFQVRDQHLLFVAKAGIISIIIFALFSYPAQILPIKMSLVLYLATIGSLVPQKKITISGNRNQKNSKLFTSITRILSLVLIFLLVFTGYKFFKIYTNAYRDWNSAYQLYQLGAYDACIEEYEKAFPVLKTNGDFLTNYGKALSMAEKHIESIDVLKQATKYYPNTVVYTALGDSYKKLNMPEQAEKAYLHAWYMNPSRFYPKYLLAKLYDENGQKEKAVATAYELLEKEIKIESTAIEEIKAEMNKIIEK